MPTKKFVLKRKYKEYLDPTAQDWYNVIFGDSDFINGYIEDARYRGGDKAAEKERIKMNQEAINTADSIEKLYRNRARRYIQGRLERESNPNFVGPTIPISIKTLPSTIKESIGIANRAEGDHPLDYDPANTIMVTRDAHWPEKGWQEGATVTYPIDTLHNIYPTNRHPNFVHYKLGGNIRRKAVLGDYEYTLAPTTVYGQGRKLPDLSQYNRVIGSPITPILDTSVPDIPIEVPEFESLNTDVNVPSIALPKISDDIIIPDIPIETPNFKPLNTKVKRVNPIRPSFLDRYGLNNGDLLATGIQVAGNLGSSLINNAMVNRLKFTPLHTMTVAEAPVKFNTTYDINPQLDNLREQIGSAERAAIDNSASSRNAFSRILGTRFRGVGAYNELYGHKLNQETNMLNADAQNRQGVFSRNASRLQQNIARDILYNTQGKDNLDNLKSNLKGQIWSNFVNQLAGSLIGTYNRGQQRISDANGLGYLFAANPNSAKVFMDNNSLINRMFRFARKEQGIG